ncbi:MAG: 23S rRNA (guanosine(2251)-2'-O)-methyltransferase RlmB [Acholeplasmataceae bacterium]
MLIYGKNVVKEALYNNRKFYKLYVDTTMKDVSFLSMLKKFDVDVIHQSKEQLHNLSLQANHQGVVAEVEDYQVYDLTTLINESVEKLLVLDSIEDPHNLGAILRTAAASGIDAVVMSVKQQVPLNATVAKVSSGGIEHIKVAVTPQLLKGIDDLKLAGFEIIGTDMSASISYRARKYPGKVAMIMGNEGSGLRPLVKKKCDQFVKIPMKGHMESLNVSVAAALLMYEMTQ